MISIKNKTGNDYFTQWDTQQALVISGELSDPVLHCRVDDTRAMVLPITDGECTLDDTLLQKRGVLDVWVYDEHRTKRSAQFRVLPKPKPDDYVATPSAAKTWEDLDERVTALEKGGGGGASADHEAVVANTAARHMHDNKSVLDGITGVVTELQADNPEHGTDLVQYDALTAFGRLAGAQLTAQAKALGLTSAAVGQLARIKAVNSNGAPTAWEAVDMPSGGSGETWEKVAEVTTTEDVASVNLALSGACKKICIVDRVPVISGTTASDAKTLSIRAGNTNVFYKSGYLAVHGTYPRTRSYWVIPLGGITWTLVTDANINNPLNFGNIAAGYAKYTQSALSEITYGAVGTDAVVPAGTTITVYGVII